MKLRTLIIDDEPPARGKVRKFLEARSDVELLGEAADGVEAINQILELKPDLVFLDIQMPRCDGFDVLREVYPQHKPYVVFTTAYDAYAIRAFEIEALDYLLKPFTADRFNQAVDRAVRAIRGNAEAEARVARMLQQLNAAPNRIHRVFVRDKGRTFLVKAAEVEWIEAEEKYVVLHTRTQKHMIRQSISDLETQLAPASFVRIHRGHIINLNALQELAQGFHGDYIAVLNSGTRLNVGRNYRETLMQAMRESL